MSLLNKKRKQKRNSNKFRKLLRFYQILKRENNMISVEERNPIWMDIILLILHDQIFPIWDILIFLIFLNKDLLILEEEEIMIYLNNYLVKWIKEAEALNLEQHNKEEVNLFKLKIFLFFILFIRILLIFVYCYY